jgi:hypothetical protein
MTRSQATPESSQMIWMEGRIEQLESEIDVEEKRFNQLADDYSEQAKLIEVLAEAIRNAIIADSGFYNDLVEAKRCYELWKESK